MIDFKYTLAGSFKNYSFLKYIFMLIELVF